MYVRITIDQKCAKVVCAIRNTPYNALDAAIDDDTLMRGIYAAAEPDGRVGGDNE